MMRTKMFRFWQLLIIGIIIVGAVSAAVPSQASPDGSPGAILLKSWELARESGSYHFSSRKPSTWMAIPI